MDKESKRPYLEITTESFIFGTLAMKSLRTYIYAKQIGLETKKPVFCGRY